MPVLTADWFITRAKNSKNTHPIFTNIWAVNGSPLKWTSSTTEFFSKEFVVLNKNAQPKDKDTVTLPGKVKFGWSPESEITIKGDGNEVFKKVVEVAQPVLKTTFNYHFIPQLLVFSSKAVETTVDGETFKLGAIQSQAVPKLVKQADGSLLIENLDSSIKTDIFSLASEESNVALSNPEFKFSVKGGNLKAAALSFFGERNRLQRQQYTVHPRQDFGFYQPKPKQI